MKYLSTAETAKRWGMSIRNVQRLLQETRIQGAEKCGAIWLIPEDADKPDDPRRKERSLGANYLPYIFVNNMVDYRTTENKIEFAGRFSKTIIEQLDMEIKYLRGDFEHILDYAFGVDIYEETFLCAATIGMAAAISTGDYESYVRLETTVKEIQKKISDPQKIKMIQTSLTTVAVSMYVSSTVPQWIKDCDFEGYPVEGRTWGIYLHAKYLQNLREYKKLFATANIALALSSIPGVIKSEDIYLRLMCASAAYSLNQLEKTDKLLLDTMKIALPYNLITPFAENLTAFGGRLEQLLQRHYPEYYKKIVEQWDRTFHHWIRFHNQFAKDNVTLILSRREYQLACFLVNGLSYTEAAERMNLSLGRVRNMISDIYGKLYINKRQELAQYLL